MKVQESFTIDGKIVSKVREPFMGFTVYECEGCSGSDLILYFVRNGKVEGQMSLEADMCQGSGYISDVVYKDIK